MGFGGELELFGDVAEEVMIQFFGSADEEVCVEVGTAEDVVHVAARGQHLLGKPRHAAALPAQLLMNQFAAMDARHASVSIFPPSEAPFVGLLSFVLETQKKSAGARTFAYPAARAFALPIIRG